MTDTATAPAAPEFEVSEDFAPRTRKATAETLTSLKHALDFCEANAGKVVTVCKGLTPAKSAAMVSLLNEHKSHDWTFGARSTDDGTAIVQAKYDPSNKRPVRTIDPAKLAAKKAKAAAKKAGGARTGNRR